MMTAAHNNPAHHESVKPEQIDNAKLDEALAAMRRHSAKFATWTTYYIAVGVLIGLFALAGTLVAHNLWFSILWLVPASLVVVPLIGYALDHAAESRKERRGDYWMTVATAVLAVVLIWYLSLKLGVSSDFWGWLLIASLLVVALAGFWLHRHDEGYGDYLFARLVIAFVIAICMVIAWIFLMTLGIHTFIWIWLTGNIFAGWSGLGGLGAMIVIAAVVVFIACYAQLIKTILSPERSVLWLIVWGAVVTVALLPAMGASALHGHM